jgi:hypothetical protein
MNLKYTEWPNNMPNVRKIYQHTPFQRLQQYTQIWYFWYANITPGNPGLFLSEFFWTFNIFF